MPRVSRQHGGAESTVQVRPPRRARPARNATADVVAPPVVGPTRGTARRRLDPPTPLLPRGGEDVDASIVCQPLRNPTTSSNSNSVPSAATSAISGAPQSTPRFKRVIATVDSSEDEATSTKRPRRLIVRDPPRFSGDKDTDDFLVWRANAELYIQHLDGTDADKLLSINLGISGLAQKIVMAHKNIKTPTQ